MGKSLSLIPWFRIKLDCKDPFGEEELRAAIDKLADDINDIGEHGVAQFYEPNDCAIDHKYFDEYFVLGEIIEILSYADPEFEEDFDIEENHSAYYELEDLVFSFDPQLLPSKKVLIANNGKHLIALPGRDLPEDNEENILDDFERPLPPVPIPCQASLPH